LKVDFDYKNYGDGTGGGWNNNHAMVDIYNRYVKYLKSLPEVGCKESLDVIIVDKINYDNTYIFEFTENLRPMFVDDYIKRNGKSFFGSKYDTLLNDYQDDYWD